MNHSNTVFDYRALRLLMGMIAFALPFIVTLVSSTTLTSISASYYTEARDIFVGLLFVVSAFLMAYNGHTTGEAWASKAACLAAMVAALYPTSCEGCAANIQSTLHYVSAAVLFAILAYFCLGPFRKNTKGQPGKKGRRAKIYFMCGWAIVACILTIGISKLAMTEDARNSLYITYWAEAVALWAFGVAWIVAGKVISPLVDDEEKLKLHLFGK
ncbi:MAG: hypothetical protein ACK2U1_23260 [Anaerolineales bacterium]|jgi:hypothetical protein